ncbi:hypothetical protein BGX21_007725 [Mortierella sp. AD011]|nr:hypothetical protein BGX20_008230 [Mortierella sp. AD010]KAF9402980.1 hypothetical protein BGX21_007725 [Mortierella sp. AD011]
MSDNNIRFDNLCVDFEDIYPSELEGNISRLLGSQYLQQVADSRARKLVRGGVLGVNFRPIISLHVQISDAITTMSGAPLPVNVHFLFMAASPQTYMSEEALRAIGVEDMVVVGEPMDDPESIRLPLLINGFRVFVQRSPSKSHFAHLNILGEDFVHASGARVSFGGETPHFEIVFP